MDEVLTVLLTALLAFAATDYTLGRALVRDPIRVVVAVVFAVLLVVVTGAIPLLEIVD